MTSAEHKIPGMIRNEFFYAIARLCMIGAIPLLGLVLKKADDIAESVAKQNVALQLLTQEAAYRYSQLGDHEQRIRNIEIKLR